MSKIGEKPIQIFQGTEVSIKDQKIVIKGKEGELKFVLPLIIKVNKENNTIFLKRSSNAKNVKALHGLWRSIINNAISGVNKLWEKRLKVVGTGYRAKMQGEDLILEVGYSHPVIFHKPPGVSISVLEGNIISVKGTNKQLVGQVAFQIKMIKKPDPYKGKGIRYEEEVIKLKPGKKLKAGGTTK